MWMPPTPGRHADGAEVEVDRGVSEQIRTREVRRGEPRHGVGTDGVEGDVAEVEQARVADDHVQADGHDREEDDGDHRVHGREVSEQRNLEQPVLAVQLVGPDDRIEDGEREHGQRQRDPPHRPGQQVEDVGDRQDDDRRRMRRYAQHPCDQHHERRRSRAAALRAARTDCECPRGRGRDPSAKRDRLMPLPAFRRLLAEQTLRDGRRG